MAFASRDSSTGLTCREPFSWATVTSGLSRCTSEPWGPLTDTSPWPSLISTPFGTAIGMRPIRDISNSLGHVADDLAAHAGGARMAIGHHATRGGDDRHPEAVHDLGQGVTTPIDAQAGARHPLEALDHRAACVVAELDLELALGTVRLDLVVLDVAFVLEDLGDRDFQFRRRHRHRQFLDALCIANAREHVGDGVAHAHRWFLPTSSP